MENSNLEKCPFCRIVNGKEKRDTVSDTDTIAVLTPLKPVTQGHVLVIPKFHCENILDIPGDSLSDLIIVVQKEAKRIIGINEVTGINIVSNNGLDAGQSIFHLHIHVIPRRLDDGKKLIFKKL